LAHWGTVVIHPEARVGANCRIHVGVVIGMSYGATPTIGDNVYIGPGVKIFGDVNIASGSVIGANSVVTTSMPAGLIAGNPAVWRRDAVRWP
jgi:serine O-acetyltransferase